MIKAFIVKCLLGLLPLTVVAGIALAQVPNDSIVTKTLSFLEHLHSGSIRYVTKSEGGTYNTKSVDTSILVFSGLDDSSTFTFILERERTLLIFDSGRLIQADRKLQTFSKRRQSATEAKSELEQEMIDAIVSRGASIKAELDDPNVIHWDSTETVNGILRMLLTLHLPSRDSDAKNVVLRYVMNDRGEILLAKTNYSIWGAPYLSEMAISHSTYNWPDSASELPKAITLLKNVIAGYRQTSPIEEIAKASPFNIGSTLPDLVGVTPTGDSIKLSNTKAKLTILDFWFAGCAPCHHMFPALKRLQEKYGKRGLKIIGVDPVDAPEAAQKMATYEGLNYDNLVVPRSVEKVFDAGVYPTLYLLDKDKKLLWKKIGEGSTEAIESIIKRKLGE
jgi:thiol-disulfide isomerase/thioredoxin